MNIQLATIIAVVLGGAYLFFDTQGILFVLAVGFLVLCFKLIEWEFQNPSSDD